jgi:hypothetical protein
MKKFVFAFVMLPMILAFGLIESNDNKNLNFDEERSTYIIPVLSFGHSQPHTLTPQLAPGFAYQDEEWEMTMHSRFDLIRLETEWASGVKDLDNVEDLRKFGKYLVDDTQNGIIENENYTVSPGLQDTQKIWKLTLKDYNSAGLFLLKGAEAYENGDKTSATINIQKAIEFMNVAHKKERLILDSMKPGEEHF